MPSVELDYPDLLCAQDGRTPFSVTDDQLDLPDGAVMDYTQIASLPNWQGIWQRRGDHMLPVQLDEGGEVPCTSCGTPGWDCLTRMNSSSAQRRCCVFCGLSDTHSLRAALALVERPTSGLRHTDAQPGFGERTS